MKNFFLVVGLFLFAVQAQAQDLGVGVMLGSPNGINLKKWQGDNAIDGGFGWDLGSKTKANMFADYLWHKREALYLDSKYPLDVHFGIGGNIRFADEINLGARFPLGVDYQVDNGKLEFFGEIAPILRVVPRTDWHGQVIVGARFYFDR